MLIFSLLTGCASQGDSAEEITWSPDWFLCDSRLQCVVVYDAYCNLTAVNRRYAIVYQDWALQEVETAGERVLCPPPDFANPTAACRSGRCLYPIPIGGNERP